MDLPPFALLVLQLAVIAAAARAVGWLLRPLLQPAVMGEMLAGVLLGPSLLGRLWPGAEAALFPAGGREWLIAAGRIGLFVHMLGVGLDSRAHVFRSQVRAALGLSLAGLAGPFVLGAALAVLMHREAGWFGPEIGLTTACVYLGAAMAITAFPVLARILEERGLLGSPLGTLVLSAGAFDDLVAWLVVSVLVASMHMDATLLLSVAFAAGLVLPRGGAVDRLRRRIEPAVAMVFLPAFFAASGLNTRLDLVSGTRSWALLALILGAATAGKAAACWLAARLQGRSAQEAAAIGALMNARGLMELVILNLGLESGIITPALFTLMATMALVTTFAASPLYELSRRLAR